MKDCCKDTTIRSLHRLKKVAVSKKNLTKNTEASNTGKNRTNYKDLAYKKRGWL
jgi:hypothetical protein